MSRARAQKNKTSASLFPFLAVLLSTMGVLVVLLVAMASVQLDQAKEKQAAESQARKLAAESPEQQQLRKDLALAEARQAQYHDAREQARESLRSAQLRTSQIEENIRRWQDRLDSLRLAIHEMQQLDGDQTVDQQQAEQRLADLNQKIERAKEQIEKLEAKKANAPNAYAILPYDGPHGTRRRPVYIECLRDRVVIQPEGIDLLPADFHPELGAGNPLAAALRAVREYYAASGLDREEEPYPLILVRPEGVGSYRAVQQAIASWDSPFGYEMVGTDWELDFGAANPEVALEIATAVDNSRERQAKLAKAAPSAFVDNHLDAFETGLGLLDYVTSRMSPDGGLSASGGGGRKTGASPIHGSRLASALSSTGRGEAASAAGQGTSTENRPIVSSTGGSSDQQVAMSDGAINSGQPGDAADATEETDSAQGAPGERSAQPANTESMAVAAGSASSAAPPSNLANSGEASQNPGQSGSGTTAVDITPQSNSGGNASSGAGRSQQSSSTSLAVQRPIQVMVRPDRLIVLHDGVRPTARAIRGRTVLLEKNGRQASERFAAAVRKHIEEWGIAGDGSYWKPVLVLNVAPGGEKLADQLSAALRASGQEVRLPNTARRQQSR